MASRADWDLDHLPSVRIATLGELLDDGFVVATSKIADFYLFGTFSINYIVDMTLVLTYVYST